AGSGTTPGQRCAWAGRSPTGQRGTFRCRCHGGGGTHRGGADGTGDHHGRGLPRGSGPWRDSATDTEGVADLPAADHHLGTDRSPGFDPGRGAGRGGRTTLTGRCRIRGSVVERTVFRARVARPFSCLDEILGCSRRVKGTQPLMFP